MSSGFLQNMPMAESQVSLLSVRSVTPSPDTLTRLVQRLRALTLQLLPVQVEPEDINSPTSRIITLHVVDAYRAAAGDFVEALPYCLLRARQEFIWDANKNAADYDENYGRAIACEAIARKIIHQAPPDRLSAIMSTRFRYRQQDGDASGMSSALEMAIDTHSTIFLSSSEAQLVIAKLWSGDLVQKNNDYHDIDYVPYSEMRSNSFWGRLDPSRLAVPRYQNFVRVVVWIFFLGVYSQAVRQPIEKLDPSQGMDNWALDEWELTLYFLGLSFFIEDMHKIFKLLRFVTWRAFTFWNAIAFITDSLLLSAFIIRMIGLRGHDEDRALQLRITSFQVLSFVAPFIWMKLLTVFDGFKYIGMMQICVARMLQESGIFFALLSVLALGFAQALYALDAADGHAEPGYEILNVLVQALLQAPVYERFAESPAGLIMYYFWNIVTAIILLNVLISLFASAYEDVVDDAEAQYLAFFAGKTIGLIRAPDSYVYPAPFNLFEVFFVSPLEILPFFRLNPKAYAKYNRFVMRIIFFIPLSLIAFYESSMKSGKNQWMNEWLASDDQGAADYPEIRDPEVAEEDNGLQISKVPFAELIKAFPNTAQSSEALVLVEIRVLRNKLDDVLKKLDGASGSTNGKDEH